MIGIADEIAISEKHEFDQIIHRRVAVAAPAWPNDLGDGRLAVCWFRTLRVATSLYVSILTYFRKILIRQVRVRLRFLTRSLFFFPPPRYIRFMTACVLESEPTRA